MVAIDENKKIEEHKKALEKIKNGLATGVRILVAAEACPVCKHYQGAYSFDDVPALPLEGCSSRDGCNCYYAPILDKFGP